MADPGMKGYWASMTPAQRSAEIKRRMKKSWAKKRQALEKASTDSPFPVEQLRSIAAAHDNPGSIKQRLEALEAALAALKQDIGF